MKVLPTSIPDLLIIEPKVFGDDRGFFFESFNETVWEEQTGVTRRFVQDNHSKSGANVLRGLHYQVTRPQGKLVRVVSGEVYDVAVDIRKSSPTFGKWEGCYLSAANKRQFWVPEGFAHGLLVVSDSAEFLYKTTDYYSPACDHCICWDDPTLGIKWPLNEAPKLSSKDQNGLLFSEMFNV